MLTLGFSHLEILGLGASVIFIYWHSDFSSETTFDQAEVVSRWRAGTKIGYVVVLLQ
jgi:hypothetical protein